MPMGLESSREVAPEIYHERRSKILAIIDGCEIAEDIKTSFRNEMNVSSPDRVTICFTKFQPIHQAIQADKDLFAEINDEDEGLYAKKFVAYICPGDGSKAVVRSNIGSSILQTLGAGSSLGLFPSKNEYEQKYRDEIDSLTIDEKESLYTLMQYAKLHINPGSEIVGSIEGVLRIHEMTRTLPQLGDFPFLKKFLIKISRSDTLYRLSNGENMVKPPQGLSYVLLSTHHEMFKNRSKILFPQSIEEVKPFNDAYNSGMHLYHEYSLIDIDMIESILLEMK